jgi:hypothetical protein
MKIEIGKKYVDGNGKNHQISVKGQIQPFDNNTVYCTYGGHWFDENGKNVYYVDFKYVLIAALTLRDLVKEVTE